MNAEPREAVCYDRVSTKRQADGGVMLDARDDSLRAYCQFKGWPLLAFETDPGRSGRSTYGRPGFNRALALACEQPGRVLVVDSMTRAFRSTVDADRVLKQLQAAGSDIVIVTLGVDGHTAAGKLVYRMVAAMAEFESDQMGERVRAANAWIVRTRGYRTMGKQPYGKWYDPEAKELVDVPEELAAIEAVKALKREQLDIAKQLRAACKARDQARSKKRRNAAKALILELRARKLTPLQQAAHLTERGILSPRGKAWTVDALRHFKARYCR
jgi:site-specific DNA recombinase